MKQTHITNTSNPSRAAAIAHAITAPVRTPVLSGVVKEVGVEMSKL